MPAYNFKDQFVPLVLSGIKRTTIRQKRKRPTVVGDRLYLFNRMRQSKCRLFKDTECVKVTPIKIATSGCAVLVGLGWDHLILTDAKVAALAKADGFPNSEEFRKFFFDTYGPNFVGELIEWKP